jgi:23S rRNA (cytosine1962-C5)-methyltransferase
MSEEAHEKWIESSLEIISRVLNMSPTDIFLKLRQRKAGRLGQYQKQDEAKNEFIVEENGLKFIVNLSDYLDTGLFLDHRVTRQLVREESKNKKLLNLFAYTGSFSVYAAAGGAKEIVTVDLSKTYLGWAERNFALNGFNNSGYKFIHTDVLQYITTLPENYFDIIVLDPPTFSNSQRMQEVFDVQRDHVSLINRCLRSMKKDGSLYFSTNFKKFIIDKENINGEIKDITKKTTPFDFERGIGRVCFLIKK